MVQSNLCAHIPKTPFLCDPSLLGLHFETIFPPWSSALQGSLIICRWEGHRRERWREVGQCNEACTLYQPSEQPSVQHKQGFLHTHSYKHTHLKTYSLVDHRNVAGVSLHGSAVPATAYSIQIQPHFTSCNHLSNKVEIRSARLIEMPKSRHGLAWLKSQIAKAAIWLNVSECIAVHNQLLFSASQSGLAAFE